MRRFRDALTTFLRPPAAAGSPGLRQPAVALACRDTVLGELQHLSRTVARGWTAPGRTAGCRGGTHPGRAGRARERAGRAAVDPRRPRRRAACGRGRRVARGRRPPSRWEAYRALAWSRLERDQLLGLLADTAEFAAALPYLDSDLPAGCWIPRPRPCARTGTPGWPPPRSPIPPHRAAAAGRGRRHRSVGRRADPAARPAGPPRRRPAAAARRRHRRGAGRGHLAPGRGRAAPPRPRPPRGTARARPAARHWLPGHGAQAETAVSLMIPAKVAGTVSAAAAAGP